MKRIYIFLFLFLNLLSFSAQAQNTSSSVVFSSPEKVKSLSSKAEDIKPILSPDGKTLYFVRTFHKHNVGGKTAGQDIWYSRKDLNGDWLKPSNKNINDWNNKDNNAIIHFSKSGNSVYLLDSYHKRKDNGKGLAISTRSADSTWSKPETFLVEGVNPASGFYDFTLNDEENILISSMHERAGVSEDLYISFKKNGTWEKPILLSDVINTNGFEFSPYLVDNTILYFSSNGHEGFGDADIYRSYRLDDTWLNWSEPENLGAEINSERFDGFFSIRDKHAFFASNRDSRFSNIYHSDVMTEEEHEEVQRIAHQEELKKLQEEKEKREKLLVLKEQRELEKKALVRAPSMVKPSIIYNSVDKFTKGKSLDHTMMYFKFDSHELSENMRQIIRQWAYMLDEKVKWRILVKGYTDSKGNIEYNKKLSKKRAIATQKFISQQGINVSELIIEAKGENDPLEENSTLKGRMKNRRTEVYAEPIRE